MSERGRPRKDIARRNMTLRLPTEVFERIEAHQAKLEVLAGGVRIARHDVLLMLLTKALDALDTPSPSLSLPAMGPAPQPSAVSQESVVSDPPFDPAASAADPCADRVPTPTDTARGQPRGQRKLTPRQVRALRDKRQRGVSIEALMEEYAISRASVFRYLQSEKR